MGMPGMFGGAQPTSAMGKGMNFLMKRMTEPPTVKPPPKGCVFGVEKQARVFQPRAGIFPGHSKSLLAKCIHAMGLCTQCIREAATLLAMCNVSPPSAHDRNRIGSFSPSWQIRRLGRRQLHEFRGAQRQRSQGPQKEEKAGKGGGALVNGRQGGELLGQEVEQGHQLGAGSGRRRVRRQNTTCVMLRRVVLANGYRFASEISEQECKAPYWWHTAEMRSGCSRARWLGAECLHRLSRRPQNTETLLEILRDDFLR